MKIKVVLLTVVLVTCLLMGVMGPCLSDDADAKYQQIVTDGLGNELELDRIPSKIVTIGAGFTATAIDMGLLDKIIVADKYSYSNADKVFDGLREKVDAGDIRASGSAYSSGLSDVLTDIWTMSEKYGLVENNVVDDVAVFITGSEANVKSLYKDLTESRIKYKYVLCWGNVSSYNDVTGMVETMSLVMNGKVNNMAKQMSSVVEHIDEALSDVPDLEAREAFFVTFSGGVLKVGNTGSLANSMILAAGGDSITMDSTKASTYETNITKLLEDYGTDVVIFIDNSIASTPSNMDVLTKALAGQEVKIVKLDPLWNNFCNRSMDGVWTMACAMYPDLFSGEVPIVEDERDDNVGIYVAVGVIGASIVAVLAFMFLRSKS